MMELVIKDLTGKTRLVNVSSSATIGELKQKIAPLFGARSSCLKLSASSGQILDNDQMTVTKYDLTSGSTLMLLISKTPVPIQVFVKNEKGQIETYDIADDETVDQLKIKVYQNEGVPVDQQRLILNGKQLDSGKKLQDYNIVSGSTIYLMFYLRGG